MKYLLIITLLLSGIPTLAQPAGAFSMLDKGTVVFTDNFATDSIGSFPAGCLQYDQYTRHLHIIDHDGEHVASFGYNTCLYPIIAEGIDTCDALKIEFAFKVLKQWSYGLSVSLYSVDGSQRVNGNRMTVYDNTIDFVAYPPASFQRTFKLHDTVSINTWHKATLYYKKGMSGCAIDGKINFISNDKIVLPGMKHMFIAGEDSCVIKNIRITCSNPSANFSRLLTSQKLITHAINFQPGRATLSAASVSYVKQLATFLKTNPTLKLEIDGHTDNNGAHDANQLLSEARAEEVKKELVKNGIDATRLTTKGFGSDKPLQPGNTPQAKAANRRVELISIK